MNVLTMVYRSFFLILVVCPFNKQQSLGLEWRLMKELHANPEELQALVEKVNSSIGLYKQLSLNQLFWFFLLYKIT